MFVLERLYWLQQDKSHKLRMRKISRYIVIALLLIIGIKIIVAFKHSDQPGPKADQPFSPSFLEVSTKNDGIFILEGTQKRIDFLKFSDNKLKQGQVFKNLPTGMVQSKDQVIVTTDYSDGRVHIIDSNSLKEVYSFSAGTGARSPVLLKSKNQLVLCHIWLDEIGIYSLPKGKLLKTIPVLRQPYASVLSPDEKYLFVSNFITHQRADQDTVSSAISIINMQTLEIEKHILLANGSNALRGISLSSDGAYVLISHNLGRFQVPTTQLEQGWMNTSALSVIEVESLNYEGTVLLDEPENGAAGSWGISCFEGSMVVAHSGTHDVSFIDEKSFFEKLKGTENRESLSYNLNFLGNIRERVSMPGNGPRAVCQSEAGTFVGMYFSDTINQIVFESDQYQINSYALNSGFYESNERLGEKYFNDASYCFQGWQACTGCHPMDARTDGLNWDLLNDGMGNPKNCKSMLLSHATPPAMITGIRPDAETAVRAGFKYIQFAQVPDSYASSVDAYLSSLKALPSPFLDKGKLSHSARRGEKQFNELGCNYCHPSPYYTDMKMHTFVSPNDSLGEQSWDSPTLIEVWRTGPYLHDGRCAKMKEVFVKEKHGIHKELTDSELNDLVAYVLSL